VKGNLPTLLDFTHSSAIGDIDNDGDIDIFVGNIAAVEPYFLINDGKAGFTKRSDLLAGLPEGRPQYTGSALVDLNGDDKLEFILGGFNSGAEILAWTGSRFEVQSHLYQSDDASRVTTDVLAADIDGDRIPEIVMISTNQSKTAFYDDDDLTSLHTSAYMSLVGSDEDDNHTNSDCSNDDHQRRVSQRRSQRRSQRLSRRRSSRCCHSQEQSPIEAQNSLPSSSDSSFNSVSTVDTIKSIT
jgi:hypothetical protein